MNADVLLKSFNETERMMDSLIERVMQKEGIWYTGRLDERFKGQVPLSELESLCQLLVTGDSVRTSLAEAGVITEDEVIRFDDKLFMLKCIAADVAEDLFPSHPNEAASILAVLEGIMPIDEDELENLGFD